MMLKMKRRTNKGQVMLLATLLLGTATSCFDDSYDLKKDIDMTINVGGENLSFPVGNTEKVTLDKIIEIEEGDDLQTDNTGAYHLLKSGEIDDVTTDVKLVTVQATNTEIDPIEVANKSDFDAAGSLEITTNRSQKKNIETQAENVDEAVKEIYELTPDRTPIDINLTKGGEIDLAQLNAKVTITFSPVLKVEEADENNQVTFNITDEDLKDGVYTYTVHLTRIAFGDGQKGNGFVIGTDRRVDINEEVKVDVDANIKVNEVLANSSLTLTPTIHIGEMEVTEVTGIIEPTLDESTSTVELTNLPDFLENDDTKLDIANPIFTFHATNPLNTAVEIIGILSGNKNGQPINGSEVKIGGEDTDPIILQPGDNTITLSRLGNGGPEGAVNIQVSDINNLIQTIPDVVNVTIQPAVSCTDYFSVELNKTYTVDCSYDIDIPLAFGSNLNIVYEETIDDLGSDLEDVDFSKAILSASIDNTIPLALELPDENVEILDEYGQKIEGIKVTVEGGIKAGNGTEEAVNSQLNIQLETTEKGTLNKLDAIKLKIVAASGETTGVQLYETQWLQLKDIKLKVPKGVTIDLN